MPLVAGRYAGLIYRALNPVYARTPLSGAGAARYGGRFNPVGCPALYAALSPVTALREVSQVGTLQPTTLIAYRADLGPVFDTRDAEALRAQGLTPETLADPAWRARMLAGQPVPTQEFAEALIGAGFAALLVRSFAKGASEADLNLVLWRWNAGAGTTLSVVDDEHRLDPR